MSSRRIVAALVAGAFLAAPHAVPAQAETPDAGASATASAPRVAVTPLIQGVVVDQGGTPVDDVKVQAIDDEGVVAATALTYASEWPDGPQHGYFFLEVPNGTYTIELSKKGYRPVEYDAGRISKKVRKISLGEIEIEKAAAPTTSTAELVRSKITTKDKGEVVVTVTTDATGRPTGDVEVREGRTVVGEDRLAKGDKGTVTIKLDKLGKGAHQLKAYFLGTDELKKSASKAVTLTVVKKRR